MQKSIILTNFCKPKISGLEHRQTQDSRLAKMTEITGFGIPGLQSLLVIFKPNATNQ